jgi:hypothetical protein
VALWRHVRHGLLAEKAGNRLTGEYERSVAAQSFGNTLICHGCKHRANHHDSQVGLYRPVLLVRTAAAILPALYGYGDLQGLSPPCSFQEVVPMRAVLTPLCYPSGGSRALGSAGMVAS